MSIWINMKISKNCCFNQFNNYEKFGNQCERKLDFIIDQHRIKILNYLNTFQVSATTSIGEGEPTSIVAQATNSRAPSRIASFSQILHKADKSKVFLPCVAVGNPTPRTRWIYREKPITFSVFFQVTNEGHLKIHSKFGKRMCILRLYSKFD